MGLVIPRLHSGQGKEEARTSLGMLGRAGTGVALHAKPSVAEKCDIRINHGDLTSLLYLQGYSRSEFVTA